jgi:hypothetical protein
MSKLYNATEVLISVAGIPIHKTGGYADGAFLRIENDTDDVGDVVGTDGEVTAFLNNDGRALATIILMASSDSNDLLAALRQRMILSKLRQGVGAFQVTDKSGRAIYNAPKCWVQKPPSAEFSREPGTREWPIRLANLTRFDGGNITML